jgi:hypothetical protein
MPQQRGVPLIAGGMKRVEATERAQAMLASSASPTRARSFRASCPADSSSASPLPAHWCTNRV